jgi:anaerobic dimethyl sulfoxide reductase subunit B
VGQMGFFFDMTACIGCKTCQIACNDKNDLGAGVLFRRVVGFEGGKFPNPWVYYVSMTCNHCAEPLCVSSCSTGALYKDGKTGAVLLDGDKCIGCKKCVLACPYGIPQYLETTGRIAKCDMCQDLISAGEEPACTSSCVMRALHFGRLDELKWKYGGTQDVKGLPASSVTNPSILIIPSPEAVANQQSTQNSEKP